MQHFSSLITLWFRQKHRILPWRNTRNPYFIWLSEVIMQQTRVAQGLDYYYKFIDNFPTVESLANADEQEVLRLWQGLGYYSRARNLHQGAKQIMEEFKGVFPSNYKDIRSIKGVGDYTAAAISSFAFDLPHPVLDGNAFRVLSRFFNDSTPIDKGIGKKQFTIYSEVVFDKDNPAEHNQAIMELGALVCKPKNPDCLNCPLREYCLAFNEGEPTSLPVKSSKTKVSNRYFHYLVFPSTSVQLIQRKGKGIWRNMYQFPVIELDEKLKKNELSELVDEKYQVKLKRIITNEKHILSHQHIYATFWEIDRKIDDNLIVEADMKALDKYPIPRLMERFFENYYTLFYPD